MREQLSRVAALLLVGAVSLTVVGVVATPRAAAAGVSPAVTVTNFDASGHKVTRFDTRGAAVDAHDGEIQQFTYQGVTRYYWYGTQDDCGLQWGRTAMSGLADPTPWCGYGIYSSDDLNTWTYEGTIASESDPTMAATCNWNSCWRPRVVFDPNTDLYVAWGDTLQPPSGYSAWTSPSPVGPWTFRGHPTVSTNAGVVSKDYPANQDEGLFVDADGTGYVIITDGGGGGYTPVVERLTPDFLNSTGAVAAMPINGVEAPSMFAHDGRYYLFVSQPNAGFSTNGTAYLWATNPLGHWTYGGLISPDSFGGQPTFSGTWRTTDGRSIVVFQSDLWYQPGSLARNQGLAGFDLSPVTWAPDGVTPVLAPTATWTENLRFADTGATDQALPSSDYHAPDEGSWYVSCDVRSGTRRSFTFVAPSTGVLTDLQVPVARSEYPNDTGHLDLTAGSNAPGAPVLATGLVPASGAGWSARPYTWHPTVAVTAGATYTVTLRSADTVDDKSCYGFTYTAGASTMGGAYRSTASGVWTATDETVKFDLAIRPRAPSGATVTGTPIRLADTPIEGGYSVPVTVAGAGDVAPAGVLGAWVELTVSGSSAAGTLVAYPGDGTTAATSFPYQAGQTRTFAALVRVGGDGTIRVSSSADATVAVDLTGWVTDDTVDTADGRMVVLPAARRIANTPAAGATVGPGGHLDVQVTGGTVPVGATAALVNLTAVAPTTATALGAAPTGGSSDGTVDLSASSGDAAVSNRVLVPLSGSGGITVTNRSGQVGLIVDLVGYTISGTGLDGEVAPLDPVPLPSPDPTASPATFALGAAPLATVSATPGLGSAVVALAQQTQTPSYGVVTAAGAPPSQTSDLNTPGGLVPAVNLAAVNLDGATALQAQHLAPLGTSALAVTGWVLAGGPQHPPSAPLAVTATAGSGSATVAWSAPADPGGTPISSYTVTASPAGRTCTWVSGPLTCVVGGLTDGTAQTFRVIATNDQGSSVPSAPASATPVGSGYTPIEPVRILDTRIGPAPSTHPAGTPVRAGTTVTLPVAGFDGVPTDATAVVVNVTATNVTGATFVTAWPTGQPPPTTSNLNVVAGDTRANLATVALGADGAIELRSAQATTDLVVDLEGYYSVSSPDRYTPLAPSRLLDTRSSGAALDAGQSVDVPVAGVGGVPADATAVVVDLTVADTTAPTFVTAYPTGQPRPLASNVNTTPGVIRPNRVVVTVGAGGAISLFNFGGSTDLVLDVVGAFGPSGTDLFQPTAPERILDTRTSLVPSTWTAGHPLASGSTLELPVTAGPGLPVSATAVVMNLTATDVTAASFVSVSPAGGPVGVTSDLNPAPGEVAANLTFATVGPGGAVDLYERGGTLDLVADLSGWFYDPGPSA